MNEPQISVRLDAPRRAYAPGDLLQGECRLDHVDWLAVQALELSVLWYTEGKGDEDFAIHHFQRWSRDDADPAELRRPLHFQTRLPRSPLSYEGLILKIRWCVRVRLFLEGGGSVAHDEVFQLGRVPKVEPEPDASQPV